MEEKKNNKGLILLICILIILVLGLIGYIVYDKVLKDNKDTLEQNTTTITTITTNIKSDEDDLENKYIAYCNNNKNEILNSISKLRNNNFESKYYPDKLESIGVENIDCERSQEFNDNKIIILVDYNKGSEYFVYNLNDSSVNGFNAMDGIELNYNEYLAQDAFNYAKELVSDDQEAYNLKHTDFNLGTFKDKTYNGNNIYVLKICEYKGEEEYCPKHYYDYRIDFNTKTFEKINVDVE